MPRCGCMDAPGTTGTREDENRAKERGFLLRVDKLKSLKKSCSCAGPEDCAGGGCLRVGRRSRVDDMFL